MNALNEVYAECVACPPLPHPLHQTYQHGTEHYHLVSGQAYRHLQFPFAFSNIVKAMCLSQMLDSTRCRLKKFLNLQLPQQQKLSGLPPC